MKNRVGVILITIFFSIAGNTRYCEAQEEQNTSPQSTSYVKIKTIKIINGDTIVSEKEYSGEGDMQVEMEDSILGDNFNDFDFKMFNNFNDSSFFERFYKMPDIFKNFNSQPNDSFFNHFNLSQFPNLPIDSIFKNFNNDNFYSPDLETEKEMLKSFLYNDMFNSLDSAEFNKPNADIPKLEKKDSDNLNLQKNKIIIHDNHLKSDKDKNNELELTISHNSADSYFNISFELDSKNKTIISLTNDQGKQLQKEIIDKTEGVYTRQFDMKNYTKGTYYIFIKQGKKEVSKEIIIS